MSNINKRFLNLDRLDSKQQNNTVNKEELMRSFKSDVQNINQISRKYNYVKYLGKGRQGYLHLLDDNKQHKYICKKIAFVNLSPEDRQQLEFELEILKYLSSNGAVKNFINPCLHSKIIDGNIYTVFPLIDGISLTNFKKYLNKLDKPMYYQIVKKIFRNILHAMGNIHNANIAHQNIDPSSILISILPENDIGVKFTDFGLGCGNYHSIMGGNDSYNIKSNTVLSKKCGLDKINYTLKLNKKDIDRLGYSKYLKQAQKIDCWKIGLILFELLMPGYLQEIHHKHGINLNEYTDKINILLQDIITNYDLDNDYHEYLIFLFKYLLVESKKRKSCNYVLDKLITAIKYKY